MTLDGNGETSERAVAETIETPAVRFAHESEEEFAKILDFYGISWQYEPRTFPLRTDGDKIIEAFTPDFYLPDIDTYIELTTLRQDLMTEKHRKLRTLRQLHPEVDIRLLNKRDYLRLLAKYGFGPPSPRSIEGVHRVLVSAPQLRRRVKELGAQISKDYAGRTPVLVGVLKGVACFMADLMRQISLPVAIDFMAISSFDNVNGGYVRILKDLDESIDGRDVLLVEDIVDTGMTLNHLLTYLRARKPATLKVCTLLDKRARRLVDVPLDYVGFEIPDEFVIGYGLDYRQLYRNLGFIATLKPGWMEEQAMPTGKQASRAKKRPK
jgi:hypoxanthine phosphoribosyltransferase